MSESQFLFYKSSKPRVNADDLSIVEQGVRRLIARQEGLRVAQIDALSAREFVRSCPESESALTRLAQAVGLEVFDADIVFCEWAAVHEDGFYRGNSFVSLVVCTGKNPYYMQTVLTRKGFDEGDGNHAFRVDKTPAILSQGDLLVFDPTVPHMAAPARPADGQLLILLQWVMSTATPEEVEALRARFVPQGVDEDIRDVMAVN
jgi:hypothetical protein